MISTVPDLIVESNMSHARVSLYIQQGLTNIIRNFQMQDRRLNWTDYTSKNNPAVTLFHERSRSTNTVAVSD
jgi:hypothetical protein